MLDLILVGGGLSNGLLADRLAVLRRDLSFLLVEAGPTLGGCHTWSFHASDLSAEQRRWLRPWCTAHWSGYEVRFPGFRRTLSGGYHAIRSEDFDRRLRASLGDRVRVRTPVASVGLDHVILESGERLEARAVIDGRGGCPPFPAGFQKFLGQDLELEAPHGLARPLLMDGSVEQVDGFRFIYALPWDERTVLVEDTRYSDTSDLDRDALRRDLRTWAESQGWRIVRVAREESAALPIPLGGPPPRPARPTVGVAAGLFHATTGYSLAFAVRVAEQLCGERCLDAASLTRWSQELARRHWRGQAFFRGLNRLLFLSFPANRRARLFSSFYGHDEALIARFYASRLSWIDKLRVLGRGAPTVAPFAALRASLSAGPP